MGLFKRRDSSEPKINEGLWVKPIEDRLKIYPELVDLRTAVQAGDWAWARDVFLSLPSAQDAVWTASELCELIPTTPLELAVASDPSDTVAAALLGVRLVHLAWDIRGSGLAKTVSAAQFEQFFSVLRHADAIFLDVLARDPANPIAGAGRITSAKGLQLGLSEATRRYEQLARHHPHVLDAQAALLQQLLPKWGGSFEGAHEFATRCAGAAPPGSHSHAVVAWYHFEKWVDIGSDDTRKDAPAYLALPEVEAELIRATEQSVLHPSYVPQRGWDSVHNIFAACFSYAGDDHRAAVHFRALGNVMSGPWNYFGGSGPRHYMAQRARALKAVPPPQRVGPIPS